LIPFRNTPPSRHAALRVLTRRATTNLNLPVEIFFGFCSSVISTLWLSGQRQRISRMSLSSSSYEVSDDEDLDDVPLTLDYESVFADSAASGHDGAHGQLNAAQPRGFAGRDAIKSLALSSLHLRGPADAVRHDDSPMSSRGRPADTPGLRAGIPDLGQGRLPATPELDEEPMPSSRAVKAGGSANMPAFRLGLLPSSERMQHTGEDGSNVHAESCMGHHADVELRAQTSGMEPDGYGIRDGAGGRGRGGVAFTRVLKPPRLNLDNAATASPLCSPFKTFVDTSSAATSDTAAHAPNPLSALWPPVNKNMLDPNSQQLLVSLLSPAFAVELENKTSGIEVEAFDSPDHAHLSSTALCSQIATSLGIEQERLRCFEVTEVPWDKFECKRGSHAAVVIKDSSRCWLCLHGCFPQIAQICRSMLAVCLHGNNRSPCAASVFPVVFCRSVRTSVAETQFVHVCCKGFSLSALEDVLRQNKEMATAQHLDVQINRDTKTEATTSRHQAERVSQLVSYWTPCMHA